MLFNSISFLIFFPLVVLAYFALPQRSRWIWLLVASYFFYGAWKAEYLILIWASTLVDYTTGRLLGMTHTPSVRRLLLGFSLTTNLGLLFAFKYFGFFAGSLAALLAVPGWVWIPPEFDVILPVGISFYTFQTLAYTIDVYRGRMEPERHLGRFALYVAFFPQLVAGPIERAQRLLHQFAEEHVWDDGRVISGLRLMGWGFFKKLVIADRLALLVDTVYQDPTAHSGIPLILATYAFAWQIYCDFSGYSDIAIGAARVLGFDLMLNFDRPYASSSVGEFWSRWHISLSTWFRDYLYIPLGGNRVSVQRWQFNLLVTFLVSGLWHGASWTFVVWGGLHGLYLLAAIWLAAPWERLQTALGLHRFPWQVRLMKTFLTFHLVLVTWVFFRAETLSDAWYVLTHFFRGISLSAHYNLNIGPWGVVVAAMAILVLEAVQYLHARSGGLGKVLDRQAKWQRWAIYYALIFAILMFGRFDVSEFIYFQF